MTKVTKEQLALDTAHNLALRDLQEAGVDPKSSQGREFLSRARAFGINAVNPPIKTGRQLPWRQIIDPDLDSWL